MAQSYKYGTFASSDLVDVPESIARGTAALMSWKTPFLTACSPNLNNLSEPCKNTVHYHYEKQWRAMRTTLNGAISTTGAITITFDDQVAKPGDLCQVDQETMVLGATSDYLSFSVASGDRSFGAGAAATHSDGAKVLIIPKPQVEGAAAATADMIVQPNKVTNYTQIYRADVGVSGTARVLDEYSRSGVSRYDANLAEWQLNLKQGMENNLIWGTATAMVKDTTAGQNDGLYERIASTSLTNLSSAALTLENLQSALRTINDFDGAPDFLFVNLYTADQISNWNLPYKRYEDGSPMAERFGATVKLLEVGGHLLNVVPMPKFASHAIIISSQFINVGPLTGPGGSREFEHTFLGVDGDRIKGQLVGEYTFEISCPYAHHMFYGVAES